jgi:hypothetical protein
MEQFHLPQITVILASAFQVHNHAAGLKMQAQNKGWWCRSVKAVQWHDCISNKERFQWMALLRTQHTN